MDKRWITHLDYNNDVVDLLEQELNVSPAIAKLLEKRGISTFEDAKQFFRPDINHLHDPFLMMDMEKAIVRIEQAIKNQEKILIYGDYDVDGTTSVSLVYSFFRKFYNHLNYYIPDRYKEGYGISFQGIDYAKENGFTLIIALDCGIKSIDKVDYANERAIDFIICDHHLPGDEIPSAVAVLDPKRKDCEYPYKELSGCGIGFKLIQAFAGKNHLPFSYLEDYLDLVAVSIASDIVPITGENRTLAFFGLKRLNENPCEGLKALIDLSAQKEELTITDIVFQIGPRINAAGRIDDAKHAVHLLISGNSELATEKGQIVNLKNTERKEFDNSITGEALAMIDNDPSLQNRRSTVLFSPNWHKGVIGIVASRLIEKYYRPTIILTESNGKATGSARSVNGFDIHEAIGACSDLLEQYGGHKYAAGLTISLDNVDAFIEKFENVVSSTIEERSLSQEIEIDEYLKLADITPKLMRIIKQFAPFGPGNMKPVFCTKNVWCKFDPQIVGNNHLKFTVQQAEGYSFDCIGFNLGQHYQRIRKGIPFDICYTIEENSWNGKTTIQLSVKDIK
ncbi:single-stranded-DNA-specific exonuclease RecJ [Solitalea sp. MAHUQ-68]|uniref:Single-stranded-DNA-specific exonuclease RecJ n=1 Tax=Solitalea agri TaxID=2953739 RepID=A0A9X2JDD9_9SPHI|nr:single-stranded-DNA-specific exonuclease RecJ [Solitalea agri]MCO4294038.1 single-stranded-DNA-specific exonuclease RecJ [Solitalea agri]